MTLTASSHKHQICLMEHSRQRSE